MRGSMGCLCYRAIFADCKIGARDCTKVQINRCLHAGYSYS